MQKVLFLLPSNHLACLQTMTLEEVKEILSKYSKEEIKINTLLQENREHEKQQSCNAMNVNQNKLHLSAEDAITRNQTLLKELEIVKGNLRSKAIYSPLEMQWEDICKKYHEEPTLPVITWKCNLPVFV